MPTRCSKLLAAVIVTVLAACSAPAPGGTGSAEDEQAIRSLSDKYAAAYAARDTAALAALVTEDYEDVAPDGRHTQGRAAFVSMVAQELAMMPAGTPMTMSATTEYVRWVDANHAVAGGTWQVGPAMPGMPSKGSWMALVVKQDTTWRMQNALGSADMSGMAPPDTTRR